VKVEIVNVTPDIAAEWLKQNTQNRTISSARVESYARDMANGDWALNGEAIKRAEDGTLLDGQQRLTALVRSGVTVPMLVVDGLPMDAQDTMDTGRARTVSDALGIHGVANATTVAAVGRRAWQWEQGNTKFTITVSPTPSEVQAFIKANPSIHRSAEIASQIRTSFRVAKQSVTGTAHHILLKINPDDAALFFAQMANGAGLDTGHPVLTLRNRFLNDRMMGKKNPFHQDIGLVFQAWNAVREGRTMAKTQHTAEAPMVKPI
jgi:hypothetical protein